MERGSRKRSSSAASEKMDRVGGRWEKMERHGSIGQSPQWAVVPMEEEERLIMYNVESTALVIHGYFPHTLLQTQARPKGSNCIGESRNLNSHH